MTMKLTNEMDSFKSVFDRNGTKIHIGEYALILYYNQYVKCQVIGFSNNYKYVYLTGYLAGTHELFKRKSENIVLVHNLKKWKYSY